MEINKTTCYCCSVVNKLSRIDYLDLEIYPLTVTSKKLARKKCYLDYPNFPSPVLSEPKAAECYSTRFASADSNKYANFSHPDNSVKKSKTSSTFRVSGEEERSQHICRICENSESTNVSENCNFESFDGFAQHMSLRHNTSVIRITTKPSKNSLKTEADETTLFKMPEVPTLYSPKNEMALGRGIINHKLCHTSTDNLSPGKINGNCNRSHSLELNNVPNKQLIKNDEFNHIKNANVNDQYLEENIIGHRNVNVKQMKHWISENDSYLLGKRSSMTSSTEVLMGMQADKSIENQTAMSVTAERVTEHNSKPMSKIVDEMTEMKGKCSSIIPVQTNVRGRYGSTSNSFQDCASSGSSIDNQIDDKNVEPAYIQKVFNHMETLKHIGTSGYGVNNLPRNRNKLFLSEYDNVKKHCCIAESITCKKNLLPKNELQPQIKYTNIPGISTTFCNKYPPGDPIALGKPLQTKILSCKDSTRLITTNNGVKTKSGECRKQENTVLISGIHQSMGSGKRKRGRPPKKAGSSSHANNVSEYFNKTPNKLRQSSNALFSNENNTHGSGSCADITVQTQVMDVEINEDFAKIVAENGAKSETAVQVLQKHLINRKIFNKINSTQNPKNSLPGSSNKAFSNKSNHVVASRLSDRIKNHHKVAKQRSEHLKKVEFLSRLGLMETSSVLTCLLDVDEKYYDDKNRSRNIKATKTNAKTVFSVNKSPSRKEVSLPDHDKIELPKKRRGRPPKKISTSIKKVAYNDKPEHKITALFVPVRKNKSQTESSRSTGRTRKTSQKYSDYVCYY